MSKFARFGEFLRNKKPKTAGAKDDMKKSLVGDDYDGPLSNHYSNDYEPQPYPDKASDEETGFVYKADNDNSGGLSEKPAGRVKVSDSSLGEKPQSRVRDLPKRKLTAEEFVNQTANLSDHEFIRFMTEGSDTTVPTVTDLYGNEFTPDPNQTISYMCGLLLANERLMSRFVREMKRRTGLEHLMAELFDHPEAYDVAVEAMRHSDHGGIICERLSRAMNTQYMTEMAKFVTEDMNENVSPPMPDREGYQIRGGKPQPQMGQGQQQNPNAQPQGQQSAGNPAAGGGSNPGPGDYDSSNSPPDPNYAKGHDPYAQQGFPAMRQPRGASGSPDFGNGPVQPPTKTMKEYAGDLAFKNLGESMIKYEDIRNFLHERCSKCKAG